MHPQTEPDPASWPLHSSAGDEIVALHRDAPFMLWIPGKWNPFPYAASSGALATTESLLTAVWWPVPAGATINGVGERIDTTAGSAGAVRRLGLYKPDWTTGWPKEKLWEIGTPYNAESTGDKENTVSPGVAVTWHGGVWVAGVTQGGAGTRPSVLRVTNTHATPGVALASLAGMFTTLRCGWQVAGVTGALPDPFTSTEPALSGISTQYILKG